MENNETHKHLRNQRTSLKIKKSNTIDGNQNKANKTNDNVSASIKTNEKQQASINI